jgi:hypothetical protein
MINNKRLAQQYRSGFSLKAVARMAGLSVPETVERLYRAGVFSASYAAKYRLLAKRKSRVLSAKTANPKNFGKTG